MEWRARFMSYIEQSPDCWNWTGGLTSRGYGKFWRDGRTVSAHRTSYELHVGPIPDGLHIDHLCRNRRCVRPDHLEPVTARDNLLRGDTLAAGNVAKTECANGHPYDDGNTYRAPDGSRMCRTCMRDRDRRRYWRLKAG
jgi:hypothetical protein